MIQTTGAVPPRNKTARISGCHRRHPHGVAGWVEDLYPFPNPDNRPSGGRVAQSTLSRSDGSDVQVLGNASGLSASQSSRLATRSGCRRLRARKPTPYCGIGSWSVGW